MSDDIHEAADGSPETANGTQGAGIANANARDDKAMAPTEGGAAADESEAHPS